MKQYYSRHFDFSSVVIRKKSVNILYSYLERELEHNKVTKKTGIKINCDNFNDISFLFLFSAPSVYPGQAGPPQAATYPSMMFPTQTIYMPQQYPLPMPVSVGHSN